MLQFSRHFRHPFPQGGLCTSGQYSQVGVQEADSCAPGTVLDMSAASVKNVPVECIDCIETTMACIIPEFTSNLLVSIALPIYLFVPDWRMALAVPVTVLIEFGDQIHQAVY